MFKRFIFFGVVFCISIFFFIDTCFAQNEQGLTVEPYFQDITLNSDNSETEVVVNVTNNTTYPSVFKLSVVDFGSLDETGGVAFVGSSDNLENKYNLAPWVSLEKDAFVLEAGKTQPIKVVIQNRESLSPGGHYAALMMKMDEADNNLESLNSKVSVSPTVASLFFVRKLGGEIYELSLKEKKFNNNIFSLPDIISLRFQNTGNIHANPRGIISIKDPLGRVVSKGIINQDSSLILPGTFKIYQTLINSVGFAYIPGKYTASIEYRFDGKADFISNDLEIFLIPTSLVLIIIATISIISGVLFLYRRKKAFSKKKI